MLKTLTTTAVGGPAAKLVVARSEAELVQAVADADAQNESVLLVGGGSNLVISDEGYPGTVIQISSAGLSIEEKSPGLSILRAAAGENWDATVAYSLAHGLSGLEALSGIPGLAGATPVQNVGAYGSDVSQTIFSVRVYDRQTSQILELDRRQLQFGYRDSIIKRTSTNGSPRYVVLEVQFELNQDSQSAPIRYAELARQLGVEAGERADAAKVREIVLELRRSKGMVYELAELDSHSTGSFFTNPIVDSDVLHRLPENAPNYPVVEAGKVKLSAAWLIDQAGFTKGYGLAQTPGFELAEGRASLSSKHTLAITNRGGATAQDILSIARAVREGVNERFGILLVNEPILVGLSL